MKLRQVITVVLTVLLLAATSTQAEVKGVSFLHRTKAKSVVKLDCDEERTGTAPPAYTCYNKNGKEQPITPGPEWQLVKLSPACLLNTVTDTVDTSCAGVAELGKQPRLYICQKDKEVFQVSKQWKPLPVDDARCGSRKTDVVELIRGDSSATRPSQIEWSTGHAGQE
ncbi:MAG: hypothetical protein QTN59_20210 [Candidatus Electrothrix communis]|nr:MAG: hypothetical protein QTN59_20210 [Candidatus Electrothrix communis]